MQSLSNQRSASKSGNRSVGMMSSIVQDNVNSANFLSFDANVLKTSLENGDLNLSLALAHINRVHRESCYVLEVYAHEQIKKYAEIEAKLERQDGIVKEVTQKCQSMQQALLYKEEKYSEKCREVERYKVICEMDAKKCMDQDLGNIADMDNQGYEQVTVARDEPVAGPSRATPKPLGDGASRGFRESAKLSRSLLGVSSFVEPLYRSRSRLSVAGSHIDDYLDRINKDQLIDEHTPSKSDVTEMLVGGHVKIKRSNSSVDEGKLRSQLLNAGSTRSKISAHCSRHVSVDKDARPSVLGESSKANNSSGVSLSAQVNEVMSSAKRNLNNMKRKVDLDELHRQVAAPGPYARLPPARRRKNWPF